MNLADCYRLLGLRAGASFAEIKASYRNLVRRYHPDVNPADRQAKEKFIQIAEAYRLLANTVKPIEGANPDPKSQPTRTPDRAASGGSQPFEVGDFEQSGESLSGKTNHPPSKSTQVSHQDPPIQPNPQLSAIEQELKQSSYKQLLQLFKEQRFPRAIALVEGLAQRMPNDPEIRQWQAITYQRWGRHLLDTRQLDKARVYLKKAIRIDPHNRSLCAEVEQDFQRLGRTF